MKTFVSSQVVLYVAMVAAAQVGFVLRFVLPGIAAGESVIWVLVPALMVVVAGGIAIAFHPHYFVVRTDGVTFIYVWKLGERHEFRRGASHFEVLNRWRLKLSSDETAVVFTPDITGFKYLKSLATEWANS